MSNGFPYRVWAFLKLLPCAVFYRQRGKLHLKQLLIHRVNFILFSLHQLSLSPLTFIYKNEPIIIHSFHFILVIEKDSDRIQVSHTILVISLEWILYNNHGVSVPLVIVHHFKRWALNFCCWVLGFNPFFSCFISFYILTMDSYSTISESSIASARASVMIYDDVNKKWIPSGSSSGLSKVHIYQHLTNNTFRVVGRKLQDTNEVCITVLQDVLWNLWESMLTILSFLFPLWWLRI